MTIRTFWTIFIKILGIWLVLDGLTVIPQFLSALSFFGTNNGDSILGVGAVLGLLVLTLCIYIFILRLFVFKTAWLIDKLHLDKGFDEEKIDLNIQLKTVLTVSTIVIGGLMLVDSLPQLCTQVFAFFQQKTMFREDPNSEWIIFYFVKALLGYFLMTNSRKIVAYIEKQKAGNADNE